MEAVLFASLLLPIVALLLTFARGDGLLREFPARGVHASCLGILDKPFALVDLLSHVLQCSFQHDGLAPSLALHAGHYGREPVEAVTDGFAALLFGPDMVFLLLRFGETGSVGRARRRALGGRHGGRVSSGGLCGSRGVMLVGQECRR
jgi:hypothetical protein